MKVLVVVPIHDRLEFVGEAIESLARQTRLPDEVVVTGNVRPEIPECGLDVRYVLTEDTLAVRVNQAIRESKCDAFALLCDDDKLDPRYLEKTAQMMERYGHDIVYTDLQRFDGAQNVMRALPWTREQIELTTVPFVTSLCKKKRWELAGGYEDVPHFDWDFWWKCFHTGGSAIHLQEPLFFYREHPGQLQYQENLAESRRLLLERHNRIRGSITAQSQ